MVQDMATQPLSLEERRRRRDQRLGIQPATPEASPEEEGRRRAITIEWAALAVLLAGGLAITIGSWHKGIPAPSFATAAWAGAVLGGLVAHGAVQRERRASALALALFAGIPLAAIPWRFMQPRADDRLAWLVSTLGIALLAGGIRWAITLRTTVGTPSQMIETIGAAIARTGPSLSIWLHDAILKWLASAILLVIGATVAIIGRSQGRDDFFWAGLAICFLIGSVGLWTPGIVNRSRTAMAIRHCGQLCFWFSLLVVPFVEQGPAATLPYFTQPSVRFVAMGIGLVIIGSTWFLQRTSIFSHRSKPEPKRPAERTISLAIVIVGLLTTVAALQARQQLTIRVDDAAVVHGTILGRSDVYPVSAVRRLEIVQPLQSIPLYVEYIQLDGQRSVMVLPLLYPGDQWTADYHSLVQAIRTAANLNTQSFPTRHVEDWSR